MPHANAPPTGTGRHRMVRLVEEEGLTFEAAAAASNVAKSTVHLWVSRWRAAPSQERASLACLEDRPSRPRRSPGRLSAADHDRVCAVRRRTGWGPRLIASGSASRTPPSTARFAGAAARGRPGRPERPSAAMSGRARATCCTWTQSATLASSGPATR